MGNFLLMLHLLKQLSDIFVLRLDFIRDSGSIPSNRTTQSMDFGGATQLTMVAKHLTKAVGHLGISHTELFIVFNFIVLDILDLHRGRLLFVH